MLVKKEKKVLLCRTVFVDHYLDELVMRTFQHLQKPQRAITFIGKIVRIVAHH